MMKEHAFEVKNSFLKGPENINLDGLALQLERCKTEKPLDKVSCKPKQDEINFSLKLLSRQEIPWCDHQ